MSHDETDDPRERHTPASAAAPGDPGPGEANGFDTDYRAGDGAALGATRVVAFDPASPLPLDGQEQPFHDRVLLLNADATPSDAERQLLAAPAAPVHQVMYVHRGGGRYYGSRVDDPARNRSQLVGSLGFSYVDIAPFGDGDAAWRQFVACFREQFARFNVTVTESEPTSGDYIEVVMSGDDGTVMGLGTNTLGYAPMDISTCALLPNAIVFVYTRRISWQTACSVAAQEVGHACGLDHEFLCTDPMSYITCSPPAAKRFQDVDAQCGEWSVRPCACGRPRQNSVRILLAKFGPSSGPGPGPTDPVPPAVTVLSPPDGAEFPGGSEVVVTARITDNVGVASAELLWDYTGGALACPSSGPDWSCAADGDTYTWRLNAGSGERTYRVRARDAAGNTTVSPVRRLYLRPAAPPISVFPTVTLLSPAAGTALRRGAPFTVEADVEMPATAGAVAVRDVSMVWSGGPTGTYQYPLTHRGGTRWGIATSMNADAPLGQRGLGIAVTTTRGDTAATAPITVTVVR